MERKKGEKGTDGSLGLGHERFEAEIALRHFYKDIPGQKRFQMIEIIKYNKI